MANYKKQFLSLPQQERIDLLRKYTHLHCTEKMNECMAKAIFEAEERNKERSMISQGVKEIEAEMLCPDCFEKTIVDCMNKTCLNYDPK